MSRRFLTAILTAALLVPLARGAEKPPDNVGKKLASFSLTDPRTKKTVTLSDFKDTKATVVVFIGTECPINNAYSPRLKELHAEYAKQGISFVAINSNAQDSAEAVAAHAVKHALSFPVLKDPDNTVADQFNAVRTPEAFVLDPSGTVLYRGRIDDQFGYGVQRPKPTTRDLADALDAVLAGRPVARAATEVAGCKIGRTAKTRTDGPITYAKHVSRLIQKHCQECHRPGQIGPFSLMTYKQAVSWSETIREVLTDGRMPPWYADPKHGKWNNDRRLPDQDKKTLLAWIDGGMPRGDDRDLPASVAWPDGWRIGTPDVVFTMNKAYEVPADGGKDGIPYQRFEVETNFKEDAWVQRAEAKAGEASVVHHILVFIVGKGEVFRPDAPRTVLCGTAPGDMPLVLPSGVAKKIPAGARLVFEMHYTPSGKPTKDRSSVGMILAKKPPERQSHTRAVTSVPFASKAVSIPPGADAHPIVGEWTFPQDGHVYGFMPHMHLRGKDFLIEAIYPDGRKETLLSVPRFNFAWQSAYRCAEPLAMPKGTKVRCTGRFDNSEKNASNPDPKARVFWGDQTWEEMMIGWMDYTLER